MNTEVAPLQGIADKVRDRIKAQFADLIPDDVYKTMVESSLQDFVKNDLPGIVKARAKEELLVILVEELKKPEWMSGVYKDGNQMAPELIGRLLRENAPFLVEAMFGDVLFRMVNVIRNGGRY